MHSMRCPARRLPVLESLVVTDRLPYNLELTEDFDFIPADLNLGRRGWCRGHGSTPCDPSTRSAWGPPRVFSFSTGLRVPFASTGSRPALGLLGASQLCFRRSLPAAGLPPSHGARARSHTPPEQRRSSPQSQGLRLTEQVDRFRDVVDGTFSSGAPKVKLNPARWLFRDSTG